MHGEFSVMGTYLLLVSALLFGLTMAAIGRRLPAPASGAAYGTAVAALVAYPLLAQGVAGALDRAVGVAGFGLLLDHTAFMAQMGGLLLTFVLATGQWAGRHRLTLGGSGALLAVFTLCWLAVPTPPEPEAGAVFYARRVGHPPAALWMNVSMGAGLLSIAASSLGEFTHFFRVARTPYERGFTGVAVVLYAMSCTSGTFTMLEAVGHWRGWDLAAVARAKAPLTMLTTVVALGMLGGQLWLRPLWGRRRQVLLRYVEPDLLRLQEHLQQMQNTLLRLQNNLLNLIARQAEIYMEAQYEAYANRAIVEAVENRCSGAAIAPERRAIARMAVILLTTQRLNLLEDPQYGREKSWDDLMTEATEKIDEDLAFNAWERARQDGYIYQDIYILMFLVLDSPRFRNTLLIDESPQDVQPWHEALADLLATVMQEHGHSTPRAVALAQRGTSENPATPMSAS